MFVFSTNFPIRSFVIYFRKYYIGSSTIFSFSFCGFHSGDKGTRMFRFVLVLCSAVFYNEELKSSSSNAFCNSSLFTPLSESRSNNFHPPISRTNLLQIFPSAHHFALCTFFFVFAVMKHKVAQILQDISNRNQK